MKRRKCKNSNEHLKESSAVSLELFSSEVEAKLRLILERFSGEVVKFSLEKKELKTSQDFIVTRSKSQDLEIKLSNFIEKAKSQISDLLHKNSDSKLNTEENNFAKQLITATVNSSFKELISPKLHTIINKNVEANENIKGNISDWHEVNERYPISVLLEGFVSSAKKKLSEVLNLKSPIKRIKIQHKTLSSKFCKENYLNSQNKASRKSNKGDHIVQTSYDSYLPLRNLCVGRNMMTSPIHSNNKSFNIPNLDTLGAQQTVTLNSGGLIDSPIHNDDESSEVPCSDISGAKRGVRLNSSGLLLLEEAERAPEYLRLTIDSEVDEPSPQNRKSDSEEDIIVLGEKRPTYQEITLEEDEKGEVKESVIEKEKEKPPDKEQPSFQCPSCDKRFRIESLLNFHVKMHNSTSQPLSKQTFDSCSTQSDVRDEGYQKLRKHKKKKHSKDKKDKRRSKSSESSYKHKSHKEKDKSHKKKKHKHSKSS